MNCRRVATAARRLGSALLAILLGLAALPGSAAAKAAARRRAELPAALNSGLCHSTPANRSPNWAWQYGVYDAQIEGRDIRRVDGQAVSLAEAEAAAKSLAAVRHHGGYAAGVCADGSAWALSLPAPSPLVTKQAGSSRIWQLPLHELRERCATSRLDFAPSTLEAPRALSMDQGSIDLNHLPDGVVSLTCQPRAPRWAGPVLWYLAPVGAKGATQEIPEASALLTASASVPERLSAWILRLRAAAGLTPVSFTEPLQKAAGQLAANGGISHDRQQLQKVASGLEALQVRFLGEDRVRASDAMEMAWLWWNSPRHRELLLNPAATQMGLAQRRVGQATLVVLVAAAATPLNNAARTLPSPSGHAGPTGPAGPKG